MMKYRLSWIVIEYFDFNRKSYRDYADFDTIEKATKKCLDLFSKSHNSYIEYCDFKLIKYEDAQDELEEAIDNERYKQLKNR